MLDNTHICMIVKIYYVILCIILNIKYKYDDNDGADDSRSIDRHTYMCIEQNNKQYTDDIYIICINYKDLYSICDCTYDYMFLNVYVERFHVVNKVNNMVNKKYANPSSSCKFSDSSIASCGAAAVQWCSCCGASSSVNLISLLNKSYSWKTSGSFHSYVMLCCCSSANINSQSVNSIWVPEWDVDFLILQTSSNMDLQGGTYFSRTGI
jgi:hypothetical protein